MIGHVGLELILDTLLIKNNSIDANSFYKQLAACDPEIIIEFLKINEIEDAEDSSISFLQTEPLV